jgi:hypothetical protein
MASWFCGCGRCSVGAVSGSLLLITLGVLFALQEAGSYSFRDTWPVLLIVYGLMWAVKAVVPSHEGR